MNRRQLVMFMISASVSASATSNPALARRRRFRRGIRGSRGIYSGDMLTQSQLENCLISQREVEAAEFEAENSVGLLENMKSELESAGRNLSARQLILNRYSKSDVDHYNALVDRYERLRAEYNEKVEGHNELVRRVNFLAEGFNGRCANKSYYEVDMVAARKAVGIFD